LREPADGLIGEDGRQRVAATVRAMQARTEALVRTSFHSAHLRRYVTQWAAAPGVDGSSAARALFIGTLIAVVTAMQPTTSRIAPKTRSSGAPAWANGAVARPPSKGGDQVRYLDAFLDVRVKAMKLEEAHSDTSRVDDAQRVFLRAGNLNLTPPLHLKVYGDPYTISR